MLGHLFSGVYSKMWKMKSGSEFFNTIVPSADINLLFTGYEQCPPEKSCGGVRSHFLLHYIVSGSGTVLTGDKTFKLNPGDLFCYSPEQPLHYTADSLRPWKFAWVGFTGARVDEILKPFTGGAPLTIRTHPSPLRMEGLFESLFRQQELRNEGFNLVSEGILLEILGELCRADCKFPESVQVQDTPPGIGTGDLQSFYVQKMRQFIHSNYQNAISVQHVVDYIGIDRSYASRIFHRLEKRTIQRYLIDLRMKKARQLLEEKRLSIVNVARSVGYQDYTTFERRFKQEHGKSPGSFPDT